jgi:DNA polymerase
MLVGEQPGHEEDLAGRPFVGPAGRLLATALEEAGLDRRRVYVTNVVKHFSWEPRGKLRIHKKPTIWQVRACRPWLMSELDVVRARAIVCLGATAAQALLGRGVRVTQSGDRRYRRRSHRTRSPRSIPRPCCERRTRPRAGRRWSAW